MLGEDHHRRHRQTMMLPVWQQEQVRAIWLLLWAAPTGLNHRLHLRKAMRMLWVEAPAWGATAWQMSMEYRRHHRQTMMLPVWQQGQAV